jgi:ferrous iron transport protein B
MKASCIVSIELTMTSLAKNPGINVAPACQLPNPNGAIRCPKRSTWEKAKGFVKKAGTFIFGGSVVIWALSYIGPHGAF